MTVAARGCAALVALLGGTACTPTTELSSPEPVRVVARSRVATSRGSAVAVTQDERIAVVANRTDGIVSIFRLDPANALEDLIADEPPFELAFHPLNESKPWEVVIAPDDDTAYVLVRGQRRVVRIVGLHGKEPREDDAANVGSEPTSLVISPTGRFLYVANSGEGTISSIVAADMGEEKWDLNGRLAALGQLGPLLEPSAGQEAVWTPSLFEGKARPGLAHPRALVLTDDGDEDDLDEKLFATEFFSQPLPEPDDSAEKPLDRMVPDVDRNRQGVVYPILLSGRAPQIDDKPVDVIPLRSVSTGFTDSEGEETGCFANQLYDAAIVGARVYITSMCASPRGPVEAGLATTPDKNNFKTLVHPTVFSVDTEKLEEAEPAVVMTSLLEQAYEQDQALERRMPLIPSSMVFAPPTDSAPRQAYISAFGASAIFPYNIDDQGTVTMGNAQARFIDLGTDAMPVGMAMLSERRALVLDDRKPALSAVDLASLRRTTPVDAVQVDRSTDPGTESRELVSDDVREGRRLFATGLDVWSFGGQAWSSCESCHPEGLSDGVTWRFTRGPRRTISLAGTYFQGDDQRRLMLWTANIDEVHDVEGITRGLSGGAGGVVWNPYAGSPSVDCRLLYDGAAKAPAGGSSECPAPHPTSYRLTGLNGSLAEITVAKRGGECKPTAEGETCDINGSRDWDRIDAFVRTVMAPQAPTTLDPDLVSRGEELFGDLRCAGCHGGPGWTISRVFYEPGLANNGAVSFTAPAVEVPAAELTGMLGSLRSLVYQAPAGAPATFSALNPPIAAGAASFRSSPPSNAVVSDYLFAVGTYKNNPPADQINCAVRSVGTFPVQPPPAMMGMPAPAPNFEGVVPAGAPRIWEGRYVKQKDAMDVETYVDKLAGGASGFGIPSLVGLAGGGPYFHAGNARSLEELFAPEFAAHQSALNGLVGALSADDTRALVSYLLSIDESDAGRIIEPPVADLGFDPDLCAQFPK